MERNFVLNKPSGVLVTPFYRLGYSNTKNDILTSTLSSTAYGPKGMILGAVSTSACNYYVAKQSYACPTPSAFPEPGSVSFPAPGGSGQCEGGSSEAPLIPAPDETVEASSAAGTDVVPAEHYSLTSGSMVHPLPAAAAAEPRNAFARNSSHDMELYFLARWVLWGCSDLVLCACSVLTNACVWLLS